MRTKLPDLSKTYQSKIGLIRKKLIQEPMDHDSSRYYRPHAKQIQHNDTVE